MLNQLYSLPGWLGIVLMIAALVHYFRTRPETYWIYIILFLGPLGSLAYLVVHLVLPLVGAGGGRIEGKFALTLEQRRRIRNLEIKIEEMDLPADRAELGELLYRRGDYERAEGLLRQAITRLDDEPEPRYWLAHTLENLHRFQEAADLLAPLVRKDPRLKFGDGYLAYARCLAGAGRAPEALTAYREVLKQSSLTEARVRYGLLLAETGDRAGAREQLEIAVREARGLPRFNLRVARPFVRQARLWLAANR
jgi:hypothetical protein